MSAVIDRWGELNVEVSAPEPQKDLSPFTQVMNTVSARTHQLQFWNHEATLVVREQERQQLYQNMNALMAATASLGTKLKTLVSNDLELHLYRRTMRNFIQTADQIHTVLRTQQARQVRLVNPHLTASEVDRVVSSVGTAAYIREALISEELDGVVAEVEERHTDIERLKDSVQQLHHLFEDLALLVDAQAEVMDGVERHVNNSVALSAQAQEDLVDADESQRKSRKRLLAMLAALLGGLGCILGPTLATQLPHT